MAEETLENVLLKVKSLESQFSDLECDVLTHGNYFAEIESENEEDRKDVEKLKERVAHIEWDLQAGVSRLDIFKRIDELEKNVANFSSLQKRVGKLENRQEEMINQLENADREYAEKFRVLTLQNNELKDHLNMTIDTVNNNNNSIAQVLSNVLEEQKQASDDDEVTSTTSEDQLTLSQVYALYQSQPQDEEAWMEMDNAIKAAEEYELRKQQDVDINNGLNIINGLNEEEWKDLLKI